MLQRFCNLFKAYLTSLWVRPRGLISLRILCIHNTYQHQGGEDSVFRNEKQLLLGKEHSVYTLCYSNEDINSFSSKLLTGLKAVYNSKSKGDLIAAITDYKPDVIHVHNFFPKLSPSIFYAAQEAGVPIVQTIHNYRFICPGALLMRDEAVCEACVASPFAYQGIKHSCYRGSRLQSAVVATVNAVHNQLGTWRERVDGFIFLTEFARDKFRHSSLKLNDERLMVKPNFVPDLGFSTNRRDHFLFVGRLTKEKGVLDLLAAFESGPHPLRIIGSGPQI